MTSRASFSSSAPAVVGVRGTRLAGEAAGTALISGQFGGSTAASAELRVEAEVVDPVVGVTWSIPGLVGGDTFSGQIGDRKAT